MNEDNKTCEKSLDLVFDWFEFTIKNMEISKCCEFLFNHKLDDLQFNEGGVNGYTQTWVLGHKIRIMRNPKNQLMGVHVLMSGFACREFEDLGFDWYSLCVKIVNCDFNISRVDIAIDMFKKYFSIKQLDKKLRNKEVTTKFKTVNYLQSYSVGNMENDKGETLTLGTKSSNIHIQFYDKLKERSQAGYAIDDKIKWWLRCELRFRKELAEQVIHEFIDQCDLSSFIFGVLKNYIDFKEPICTRMWNCPTWAPWQKFLGDVEKVQIAKKSVQSSIQKKDRYAKKQFVKTLSMLYACFGEDYIKSLLSVGFNTIGQDELSILNNWKLQQGEQILTNGDLEVFANKFKGYDLLEFVKNH